MPVERTIYEVYVGGELAAVGTKEQCAEAVGLLPETVKSYAAPSKQRAGASVTVRRVGDGREAAPKRIPRQDPRISTKELREAMRRRHDEMLGLVGEWEL